MRARQRPATAAASARRASADLQVQGRAASALGTASSSGGAASAPDLAAATLGGSAASDRERPTTASAVRSSLPRQVPRPATAKVGRRPRTAAVGSGSRSVGRDGAPVRGGGAEALEDGGSGGEGVLFAKVDETMERGGRPPRSSRPTTAVPSIMESRRRRPATSTGGHSSHSSQAWTAGGASASSGGSGTRAGARPATASARRPKTAGARPSTAAVSSTMQLKYDLKELEGELKMRRAGKRPSTASGALTQHHAQFRKGATDGGSTEWSSQAPAFRRVTRRPRTAGSARVANPYGGPDRASKGEQGDYEDWDDPTGKTYKKLAKDDVHFHERQTTLRLLRSVELGSKRAAQVIAERKARLRELDDAAGDGAVAAAKAAERDAIGDKHSFRLAVVDSKDRGREALFAHAQDLKMSEVRQECQRETAQVIRRLKTEIAALEREINSNTLNRRDVSVKKEEYEMDEGDFRHTIQLLRQKIQAMGRREMEYEMELKNFTIHEEIFDDLATRYDFNNAEEVVAKLESLEMAQIEKTNTLLEAKESTVAIAKDMDDFDAVRDSHFDEETADLTAATAKVSKQLQIIESNLRDARQGVEKAREARTKNELLIDAVAELYNFWEPFAEVPPAEAPDFTRPLDVLTKFRGLFRDHAPTKVGRHCHAITQLAGRLWKRFFSDHPAMKAKPLDTYQAVTQLLSSKTSQIASMNQKSARAKKDNAVLQDDLRKLGREKNRLRQELDKWRKKWETDFGRFEDADDEAAFDKQYVPLIKPPDSMNMTLPLDASLNAVDGETEMDFESDIPAGVAAQATALAAADGESGMPQTGRSVLSLRSDGQVGRRHDAAVSPRAGEKKKPVGEFDRRGEDTTMYKYYTGKA